MSGPYYANWHAGDTSLPCAIVTGAGYRIAKMNPTTESPEREANARLFEASPDLYCLANEAVREYDKHGPNVVSSEWLDEARRIVAHVNGEG